MLKVRIIPCLDVKDGRVVKGVNFVDLIDAGDPVQQAQAYDKMGADELTLLDITASSDNRNTIYDIVQKTAESIFMPFTVGGGVRNLNDISNLLMAGADKVSINTEAVRNPEIVKQAAQKFGSQCITVAVDAKAINADNSAWRVFTHGGRNQTELELIDWVKKMNAYGAGEILLTSMDKDGTKDGFNLAMTKAVADAVTIPVVASGGVGNLQHLVDGVNKGGAAAVLAASIFHFGEYTIKQAKEYMANAGVPVRLIK